jgi:virginiamycin A acetyltransferase
MEFLELQRRSETRMGRARSPLAPLFRLIAHFGRIRSLSIRAICRLEGGQMWSTTYRELMREHYGVRIGTHSYGPALLPGNLPEGTRVGNYCSLASGITVLRRNHPTSRFSQHPFFFNSCSGLVDDDTIEAVRDHPLTLEHDVWIGANAIITPRCQTIGLGAVVGAGAVVTKDVAPFTIVAGVPAVEIGKRFQAEIQKLLMETQWWDYPLDRLCPAIPLFFKDATVENAKRLREYLGESASRVAAHETDRVAETPVLEGYQR